MYELKEFTLKDTTSIYPYELQRQVDEGRVIEIYKCYNKQIKNNKKIIFEQPIIMCKWNLTGDGKIPVKSNGGTHRSIYAIVDGQHRVLALKMVRTNYPNYDQSIPIFVHNVTTLDEVKLIQMNLFKQKPVALCDQYIATHNMGTELNSFDVVMNQSNYDLNRKSDDFGKGCSKWRLIINKIINLIRNSPNHESWISSQIKGCEICDKVKEIQHELISNYNTTNDKRGLLKLNDITEKKFNVLKSKIQENPNRIVAIRYYKKYDDLLSDIELKLNISEYDSCESGSESGDESD